MLLSYYQNYAYSSKYRYTQASYGASLMKDFLVKY